MTNPLLTIMLPTTIDRRDVFKLLLDSIQKQISENNYQDEIEVIIDEDNKEKSIGKKRQDLLERANGLYVVGVDSDDSIAETYIKDIMQAILEGSDHIGFLEKCNIDGQESLSIFSIRHKVWDENKDGYDHIRCANPKSVIKREKALLVGFEDSRFGEDRVFSEKVTQLLQTETFINKELYFYNYISTPHIERYGFDKD